MDERSDGERLEDLAKAIAMRKKTYADVVKKQKGAIMEASDKCLKRCHPLLRSRNDEVNLLKDCLINLCNSQSCVDGDRNRDVVSVVDISSLISWLEDTMRLGVCIFFMAKSITGLQVRMWVRSLSEGADPEQVFVLGKSCFYIRCKVYKQKYSLLSRSAAWCGNLFGIPLPWDETFDPSAEFAIKCPVWVTLKNVPVFLSSHMEQVRPSLGRILYIPKLGPYVPSRSIKICVLWQLETEIPEFLKVLVDEKKAFYIKLVFDPFPLACSRCNKFGHYARVCPFRPTFSADSQFLSQDGKSIVQNSKQQFVSKDKPHTQMEIETLETYMEPQSDGKSSKCVQAMSKVTDGKEDYVAVFGDTNPFSVMSMSLSSGHSPGNTSDSVNVKTTTIPLSKKTKKKKAKKKKKIANNDETTHFDDKNLFVELNSDVEVVKDVPAAEEELKMQQGENDSSFEDEEASEVKEVEAVKAAEETELAEGDLKILQAVPEFMHAYYSKVDHMFYIPAVTQKINTEWVINAFDRLWNLHSFFKDNNISPIMVVFDTTEGEIQWKGRM